MPAVVEWGSKFERDPDDPRYVKVVGKHPEAFLNWCRRFGKPAWNHKGEACVQHGLWLRDPSMKPMEVKPEDGDVAPVTIRDKGLHSYWLIPISILEKWYNWDLKVVTLLDQSGKERTRYL